MAYLKHLAIGITLLTALGAGANLAVDPFDIFGMPRIERFNTHKSIGAERLAKPLQTVARRPKTVILGSSRCLHGIDPKDATPQPAYNLSVPGALADELAALARHVADATTAEALVLCLDFVSFNDDRRQRKGFYADVLGQHGRLRALPRTVFSYAALKRSRDTLRNSLRQKPTVYRGDGFRPFEPRAGKALGGMITPVASFLSPGGAYRDFPGFEKKLAGYPALLSSLKKGGLTVTLAIPPIHATQMEAIAAAGLWPMFEDWKRGVAAACSAAGIACWDFAGYYPVTTEALARPPEKFGDSSHFLPPVGKRILARISGRTDDADQNFGWEMTLTGIDGHLAAQRTARDRYRRDHADDVAAVRDIARQYGFTSE